MKWMIVLTLLLLVTACSHVETSSSDTLTDEEISFDNDFDDIDSMLEDLDDEDFSNLEEDLDLL